MHVIIQHILKRSVVTALFTSGRGRERRVGRGLDSSMDWIGLDWIGLDWVEILEKILDWIGSKVLYIKICVQCIPEIITAFVYFVS